MDTKKFVVPYVLIIISLILAACAGPAATPQEATEQPTAAPEKPTTEPTATEAAPPESAPEVVIHYLTVQQENEGWPLIIGGLTSEYQADHPNVKWEYEFVNQADLGQRIQLLAGSNSLPLLFNYESGAPLLDLVKSGQVLELEQTFKDLGIYEELNPGAVSLLKGLINKDRDFINSFWFSARYAVVVTTGQVFFGLLLALLYVFYLKRSSAIIRTLVFSPVVLPTVAVAQMFVKLFEIAPQYGLVNAVLDRVGLDAWIQPWLGQGGTAFWIAAIMNIWTAMGFYAVILYAGLLDIPVEIIESARLDGAKGWSLVWFIIRPLLMPILVTSLIFSLNGTLKVFDQLLALTNGGPGKLTTPLTLYMYRVAFTYNQYGYGSAIAVVLTLECLLVTLLVYRFARKDIA